MGLREFVEFLLCKEAETNRVNEIHNCASIYFATKGGRPTDQPIDRVCVKKVEEGCEDRASSAGLGKLV